MTPPNRETIVFHRTPKGVHDRNYRLASLWIMKVDGTALTQLRAVGQGGWTIVGHVEWHPNNQQLVMIGGKYEDPQIFITDVWQTKVKQVTNRRLRNNLDPSFSASGKTIAFVSCPRQRCPENELEVYRMSVATGVVTRLTVDNVADYDPYFAPDGKSLAWLTRISSGPGVGVWDIRLGDAMARSPKRVMKDTGVTSRPQWTKNGQTLVFHRLAPGTAKFDIYSSSRTGKRVRNLTGNQPGSNEYPSVAR